MAAAGHGPMTMLASGSGSDSSVWYCYKPSINRKREGREKNRENSIEMISFILDDQIQ